MIKTDDNNTYVLLAEDDTTGEAVPVKCDALGNVLVFASTETVTATTPNVLQDENYIPIARVNDDNNEIGYLHIGTSGTLLVQE